MKLEATLGAPAEDGLYAARQWYGYRILEWHKGEWWHPGLQSKWGKTEIEAHIGPLPTIVKDFSKPAPHRGRDNRVPQKAMEFDL